MSVMHPLWRSVRFFLFFLIALLSATPTSLSARQPDCETLKQEAREARDDQDLDLERTILEEAAEGTCSRDSWVHSQLALCFIEVADKNYNDKSKKDDAERALYFNKALEMARKAEQLDPTNYYAYEHKAMAFGGLVDVNRLKQKVHIADSIRVNAEIALQILPENDRAMHILGRWHYEVATLNRFMLFMARLLFGSAPEASIEEAEDYFLRASQVHDLAAHSYWLGLTYLEQNEPSKARERFQRVLNLPVVYHNDPYIKKQARKQLQEL